MDGIKRIEEEIEEQKKIKKQLENQIHATMQRDKNKQRKARTRQLIQMGALTEKYFGIDEVGVFEEFLSQHIQLIKSIVEKENTYHQ